MTDDLTYNNLRDVQEILRGKRFSEGTVGDPRQQNCGDGGLA